MILPTPTEEQLKRSEKLCAYIQQKIKASPDKVISFADYMAYALYTPELGYYMAKHPVFGRSGDFVTAPELSPIFAQCLARHVAPILEQTEDNILEIGAGSGRLAADLLMAFDKPPEHYSILEISPALQQRQQEYLQKTIPHLYERIHWLTQLPENFSGCILANEVMDALPADCFEMGDDIVYTRGVSVTDHQFHWKLYPASEHLQETVLRLKKQLPNSFYPSYHSEIQLCLPEWICELSKCLKKGSILLIDYGFLQREYYHHDRNQGTLMCHYRQHATTDPFWYPGLQDITVHVDFDAVGNAALAYDLEVIEFSTQAQFLIDSGLIEILERDPELSFSNKHAIQLLTSPAEMGELFKVMELGRW